MRWFKFVRHGNRAASNLVRAALVLTAVFGLGFEVVAGRSSTNSPTPTPTPTATSAPAPGTIVHVVKTNEWVWSIARVYRIDPQIIIRVNHLYPPFDLRPGERLLIPPHAYVELPPPPPTHKPEAKQAISSPRPVIASAPSVQAGAPPKPESQVVDAIPAISTAHAAPVSGPPRPIEPPKPAPPAAEAKPSTSAAAAVPVSAPQLPARTSDLIKPEAPVAEAKPAAPSVAVAQPVTPPPAPVFAARTGKTVHIVLSVKDGNRYVGDVLSTIAPDGAVTLDTAQFRDILKSLLSTDSFAAASAALGNQKESGVSGLATTGINARYDAAQLQIVLDIPAPSRPSQSLLIAELDRSVVGDVAKPARFSAYINARGSIGYIERGAAQGLEDPTVLLDGAARLFSIVAEGEAQYASGRRGNALSRQGTRLTFDDESNLMRWTLGDLRVQTEGFQGSRDMLGLSVVRLYDQLAPQLNVRPRGNRSFTLTQASTVQTFVNGQQVQQVRLDPGTYNAGNFPFVEGANDVHVVITNDAGAVENLNFSIFFDRALMRPGLFEFGAYCGVASDIVDSAISYPHPRPAFTGFIRYGLTEALTSGVNFQADEKVQMGGVTGLWGSPIGTIGFDIAGSQDKYAGTGYALNLGFNRLSQDTGNFQSQTVSASFELRSRKFSIMSQGDNAPVLNSSSLGPNNPYRYQAAVTYSRSFGEYTFAQIDARYARSFKDEDYATFRASVGYSFTNDLNINTSVQYATSGFQKGISAGIQLTYRIDDRSNVRADYQTQTNLRRLSYQNSQGRGVGAWSVSGDLESVPGSVNFNGSGDYAANRAQLGAAQTVGYDMHGGGVSDVRTSLRAGSSLAFADGSVGVGRPIFDSFALFDPHPSLGKSRIVVEPSNEGDLARSDALGPALLSDMGSHSLRTVTYDVPEAPAGYDIGSGSFRAIPPHKSGYLVPIGSDYSLTVWGRLLARNGEPVPLIAGQAVELAPDGKKVTLFTSRDGRFSAQGLRPGRWRIEIFSDPPMSYEVQVEKGPASLVNVGDLKPAAEEAK